MDNHKKELEEKRKASREKRNKKRDKDSQLNLSEISRTERAMN